MKNPVREYRDRNTGAVGYFTEQFAAVFPQLELVPEEIILDEPVDVLEVIDGDPGVEEIQSALPATPDSL